MCVGVDMGTSIILSIMFKHLKGGNKYIIYQGFE
jgi:hypothetical protein